MAGQNVPDYNLTQRLHVLESAGTDPMGSAIDGTQSLTITPLSNPYTISGARRTISQPTLAWERQTAPVNEGAEPLCRYGRTMIVYSASACWGPDYKLGLLTLTGSDPLNRSHWTKSPNPVFQRNDGDRVFAPGHNGFFKSPDGTEDWIVYHARPC